MIFEFDDFRLDSGAGELHRAGEEIDLERRPFEVLCYLVRHRQRTISSDELMDRVWPGVVVGQSAVSTAIKHARRALGDDGTRQSFIRTLRHRGFRFVPEVREVEPQSRESLIGREQALSQEVEPTSPIAPERAQGSAERRQLTVLFCNLVDPDALSEQLDDERLLDVMRVYRASAAKVISSYEGQIAQYLGETLVAYFGYPQAHEDDAERATRAGIELLSALDDANAQLDAEYGVRLQVRIGIDTGRMLLAEVMRGEASNTVATGDSLLVAAGLQELAEPNSVVISETTQRLVRGIFTTRTLGEKRLRGVEALVHAHAALHLTGVRNRLDLAAGELTPFVGREQQLGLLFERWERVLEGEGQMVLVSGEAGVGKSRLARTLRERMSTGAWLEATCSPYASSTPLHPVVTLLNQLLDFQPDDSPNARLSKLEQALEKAGLPIAEAAPLISALIPHATSEGTVGLVIDPEIQRRRTLDMLVAWMLALGGARPTVLLIEDLHWIDPSSLELLGLLMQQIPSTRIMILATARPDFETPWALGPSWTPLTLPHLPRDQARELVSAVEGAEELSESALALIVERSDGIPLYLEELTRAALDVKATGEATEIPISIQDSLMARLDRLGLAKEVAQLGSLLGREFSYTLLAAVSDLDDHELRAQLTQLATSGLVFPHGAPPEATYTFRHSLIQDTAYDSLPTKTRRRLHSRVAAALEANFPAIAESLPETLALHCERGGREHESVSHYERAGRLAAERSANLEATRHFRRSLEVLGRLPEGSTRDRKELSLRGALGAAMISTRSYGSSELEQTYLRAQELARRIGDVREYAKTLHLLAMHNMLRSRLSVSQELATEMGDLAEGRFRSQAQAGIGVALFFAGNSARALESLAEYIASEGRPDTDVLPPVFGYHMGQTSRSISALAHFELGYPDRALAMTESSLEIGRASNHPFSLAFALVFGCALYAHLGQDELVRKLGEEAITISDELDFPLWRNMGRILRCWATAGPDSPMSEIETLRDSLAQLSQADTIVAAPESLRMAASTYRRFGRPQDALGILEIALAFSRNHGNHSVDAELHRQKGELLREIDGGTESQAEAELQQALEIARRQNARSFELRAATSMARLWQGQDLRNQARSLLSPIYEWFTEGFDTPDLEDAKLLLEELS